MLSALRFNHGQDRILGANLVSFIFVYDLKGELLAKTCQWHTKDQWNYLELIDGHSLLLASANQGQIMFFTVPATGDDGEIRALTGEFDNWARDGGAIVSLDMLGSGDRLLTTHHLGSAFVWRLEKAPEPHLIKLHHFAPPSSRPKKESAGFELSLARTTASSSRAPALQTLKVPPTS